MKRTVPERVWSRVSKTDGCWNWTGARTRHGYGAMRVDGRVVYAHRVVYSLEVGPIAAGLFVCHRCDNPTCVRPDHLFLGTNQDNMRDASAKGRTLPQTHPERLPRGERHPAHVRPDRRARGDRHGSRTRPDRLARGERQGNAKLTAAQVQELRAGAAAGASFTDLGRRFGVSRTHARRLVRGEAWAHVHDPSPSEA